MIEEAKDDEGDEDEGEDENEDEDEGEGNDDNKDEDEGGEGQCTLRIVLSFLIILRSLVQFGSKVSVFGNFRNDTILSSVRGISCSILRIFFK